MIFIDTSAWIAIQDRSDENYRKAMAYKDELFKSKKRMVTTNYVLDETYTLLLFDVGYRPTVRFKNQLDELISTGIVVLFHITPAIEREAWKVFEQFNQDKRWSFTDCTSKVVMDKIGILEVFAFDKHFVQMGMIRKP